MKIKQFIVNPFQINCFVYYDENSKDGIVVDPGAYTKDEEDIIKNYIKDNKINIKYILNTHGHIDHILGNKFAKDTFNVPMLIHKDDLFFIDRSLEQSQMFGIDILKSPDFDDFLTEDSEINLNETKLNFIHTPGHSPGSVCLVDHKNKNIFCGDLIFKNSIGRTDLPMGSYDVLIDSIKNKLFAKCSDDYTLYPGHMEATTIINEKQNNPFLNQL
jgi:glyoxylase-like metal-dependent hydrolase (beta-lactamase superfamily II)